MKLSLWFCFVTLLLCMAGVLAAQTGPVVGIRPDTIYVGADGKFESAPDTALVQFNIAAQEPVLKDAYARAQRAAEQVRTVLKVNGVDPKQAEIGTFQVEPVYDYRTPKRKLLGYRVNSNISLKLKDFSKIGPLAAAFAEMDVTENQSINYLLEEIDAAKAKAAEDAFNKARLNAQAVAKAGGRVLGELSYASVDTFEVPIVTPMEGRMMKMSAADNAPPPPPPTAGFSAQKITVTAHVNALFALK